MRDAPFVRSSRLTILLSGMIAADPHQGGATWAVLQYVLGLQRLGHEVFLVEPLRAAALRPNGAALPDSVNARYFWEVVGSFDLADRSALLLAETRETAGLPYEAILSVARRADLLLNISGMLADPAILEPIPRRVYLDLDPAFNQLWHAVEGIDMRFDAHTHFITVGLAIGSPSCPVPLCGRRWIPTLQPVALQHWPLAAGAASDALTTVGSWRGYGSVEHKGVFYGQRAHSVRPIFALPTRTETPLALALNIHPDEMVDLDALHANGWRLLDPYRVAGTPQDYRAFIQGSRGELGIAKSGYVVSHCGWFSDRSACYLASGRPVIAQETGFSRFLPTGEGLFAWEDLDSALAAIEALPRDYDRHRQAARCLAEEYFDSDRVLGRLLDEVGGAA